MLQDDTEGEVIFERRGALAVLTLNRPKALNALSLDMIRQISSYLHAWKSDKSIQAVLFQGAGDKAFCAGGDIKAFYKTGMSYRRGEVDARVPAVFFAEEYAMNCQIFHYPKPLIALMDGVTMGGGYGIAGHCRTRVATEHTEFAMPEVRIGLFPDVGAMYHLQKAGAFGYYLAVTGESISGAEMLQAGLADYYVSSRNLNALIESLNAPDEVEDHLKAAHEAAELGGAKDKVEKKAAQFHAQNLKEVMAALKAEKNPEAGAIFNVLQKRSPTSLAVVDMYWQKAQAMDFNAVMATDFTLIQHFIAASDMYEGIRAQVIDKDRNPYWSPVRLEDINPEVIAGFFADTGYNLKDVQIFDS